jgi:hypothetical protein
MRNNKQERKIKKVNRMTTDSIKALMFDLEKGQTHTYTNSQGNETTKQGSSHASSKYYRHLKQELVQRLRGVVNGVY